ncbi:MAG: hypothetical protein V3V35_05195 [Dehalococcoidia bacterium]
MNARMCLALLVLAIPVLASCAGSSSEAQPVLDKGAPASLPTGPEQALGQTSELLSTRSGPGAEPGVPPSSVGPDDSRLRIKLGGIEKSSIPLRNGGLVNLGDGLTAELFVDPYPTDNLTAWIDLYLAREDGQAIDDAHVLILYDMWSMGHGPYTGLADSATDGHYVFRLDYIMFGAWEQVFEIRLPDSDLVHRLVVIIVAMP